MGQQQPGAERSNVGGEGRIQPLPGSTKALS